MDFLRYEEFYIDTQERYTRAFKFEKNYYFFFSLFVTIMIIWVFYRIDFLYGLFFLIIPILGFFSSYSSRKEQKKAEENLRKALRLQYE